MKKVIFEKSILSCVLIFLICCIARVVEYFGIRTDETILAENFIHKVFGIIILVVMLVLSKLSWDSIGFTKTKIVQNLLKGLALGVSCFSIAYLVECVLLYCMNGNVQLSVYTSGFSLNGEAVKQTGIGFILLCITFNLINVWMEEGIFRGLFSRLLENRMSFKGIVFFIALLFGVWHWVMPMRDYIEGDSSLGNLLVMGIGDHLFNNIVVTNLLHVISNNEADNLQIIRILIGQLISFVLVMSFYKKECSWANARWLDLELG